MSVLTETQTAPIEVVTPILPSEALRLGRLIYPERYPHHFTDGMKGACALGAMLAGWGDPPLGGDGGGNWDAADARLGSDTAWNIATTFDNTERLGEDGDAAVLAMLAERGL